MFKRPHRGSGGGWPNLAYAFITPKGRSEASNRLTASQAGFLVTDALAQKQPEVVTRGVKALLEAAPWASQESNREALLQFVAARSVAYEYVREAYAGALRERFNPLIDESSVAAYLDVAKVAVATVGAQHYQQATAH
ncbi:MAG: hypothetical protein VYB93_10530 [Pseudomonadota bacterium]|nr:hypothetical protein [Pseudomonadota bacterium]